jgi:hypothetical protein
MYNILREFGVPMKLVRLIKVFLNETYSKFRKCKPFSDNFPTENGLNKEMLYRHRFWTSL